MSNAIAVVYNFIDITPHSILRNRLDRSTEVFEEITQCFVPNILKLIVKNSVVESTDLS